MNRKTARGDSALDAFARTGLDWTPDPPLRANSIDAATWLEQGRGGAPSADVLDRIAKGLMLTEPEREHLYMLGLGRPPEARYQPVDGIFPRLQRVLDGMVLSPAIIKTAMWDVVGWTGRRLRC